MEILEKLRTFAEYQRGDKRIIQLWPLREMILRIGRKSLLQLKRTDYVHRQIEKATPCNFKLLSGNHHIYLYIT